MFCISFVSWSEVKIFDKYFRSSSFVVNANKHWRYATLLKIDSFIDLFQEKLFLLQLLYT